MMAIETALIPCIKVDGEDRYQVTKSLGIAVGVHEMAHLLKDATSKKCIASVSYAPEKSSATLLGLVHEGVALSSEYFALPWMSQNRKNLGIRDEMELATAFVTSYLPTKMQQIVYSLMIQKEKRDDISSKIPDSFKTEALRDLERITGMPVFRKDPNFFDDFSLYPTLWLANYFFGQKRIAKITQKAKKKFKINPASRRQNGMLLQGLLTGEWTSYEAQEKFVLEHFLPQAVKDGILQN